MRMKLLFSILLLVPLIFAADPTGDLGFNCDVNKCTFTLSIPESAVSFVDVGLLREEIYELNNNVTALKSNEVLIHADEDIFNGNFSDIYVDLQSSLTEMFAISFDLNETSTTLIDKASVKEKKAMDLNTALKCMVDGVKTPKECGNNVPDVTTTKATPVEPATDDGSTDKTPKPTEEPFTGSTTTPEPFTGTTTTEVPFTGSTVTEEAKTVPTTTEGPDVTEGSGNVITDGSTTEQSATSSTGATATSKKGADQGGTGDDDGDDGDADGGDDDGDVGGDGDEDDN